MTKNEIEELKANYPHGAYNWLLDLAYWLVEYNVFNPEPRPFIIKKISVKDWLDSYYMNCYSAKEAVIEDLKHA